jgi:hypothetical protein
MEEIGVCIVVQDNYYKIRYVIENLVHKTNCNIKFYILNNASQDKRIGDYCSGLVAIKDGYYCEVEQPISVSRAYNILLRRAYQKYVVFFPANYLVNNEWCEDLLVSIKTVENAGSVGIRNGMEKLHLSPLTHKTLTLPEDVLLNVWVSDNNLLEGLFMIENKLIELIGHLDERDSNEGYQLMEYTFRIFQNGYKNYYIRKQTAQKINIDSDILFPNKSDFSFKQFKADVEFMIKNKQFKKYYYEKSY